MSTARSWLRRRGQATLEYVVLVGGLVIPFTFGLIAIAQLLWVYHTAVEFTRMGARYATTHCWQADASNVREYMRNNVPPVLDAGMLVNGPAELDITYLRRNAEGGPDDVFSCDGECSTACIPDKVNVRIRNYEFRRFVNYLGLPPIKMPEFGATMPMESAGCDPDGTCVP